VRKAGRQFIEIDEDKLEKLAALGLTNAECAAILDCSPDTLERNYKETMAWGRSHRDASLRRKQFEIALAGNPTMLIWLGKQYLGQSDKTAITGVDGGPIVHEIRGMKAVRDALYGKE
jgi:hypothetical protein